MSALVKLERGPAALVIIEHAMPKMSGGDLIKSMKDRELLRDIPVIVLILPWMRGQRISLQTNLMDLLIQNISLGD